MSKLLPQSQRPDRPLHMSPAVLKWSAGLVGLMALGMGSAYAINPSQNDAQCKLMVREKGLYRVTYEQIKEACVDLKGVRVERLSLRLNGQPVARFVKGQDGNPGQSKFCGPGCYIELIGQPRDSLYGQENAYTISVTRSVVDSSVKDVAVDSVKLPKNPSVPKYYLESVTEEPESLYSYSSPNGDPWYAARMLAYGRAYQGSFSITLDSPVTGDPTVPAPTLTVGMWGGNDWANIQPDHHVKLSFNDQAVGPQDGYWFDGMVDYPVSTQLPAVKAGANTLTISLPRDTGGSYDLVGLDRWSVTYPRPFLARDSGWLTFTAAAAAFTVNGLTSKDVRVYRQKPDGSVDQVTQLSFTGECASGKTCAVTFGGSPAAATYYVATTAALRAARLTPPPVAADITSGEVQYLVIAHPNFIGADLQKLVDFRASQGYKVKVVAVDQVYAQFGHHQFDPQAIKNYIAYARDQLKTKMVLLVGGDTYQYQDDKRISFIPSLYAQTDKLIQFAPADPLFTAVGDNPLPTLPIGRLPVRTGAELAVLVQKIIAYETQRGGFTQTAVLTADAYDAVQKYDFKGDSEAMMNQLPTLPNGWRQPGDFTRVYMDDIKPASAARAALRNTLNQQPADQWIALTTFFGHSAQDRWTFQGLFGIADANDLTNTGKPTVVTQWGCWNNYFVSPTQEAMAHKFLFPYDAATKTNRNAGAAAVLGAATLTQADHEQALGAKVNQQLFVAGTTLGQAMQLAKEAYVAELQQQGRDPKDYLDVLLGWTLLGDPATVVVQ